MIPEPESLSLHLFRHNLKKGVPRRNSFLTDTKNFAYILIMCSIWAGNYFAIKGSLQYVDPITLSILRAFLGGLIVLVPGLKFRGSIGRTDLGWLAVVGLFNVSLFLVFLNLGLLTVSTSVASTLVYTQPVLVVALSPLIKERLNTLKIVGIVSAFAGIVVIFYPSIAHSSISDGDLYEVGSALSWAIAVLLFKKWDKQRNSYLVTAVQSLFGGIFILPFLSLTDVRFVPNPHLWVYLAYNIVLATAVAYTLYFRVLAKMDASRFSSYLFLVPVLTTLFESVATESLPAWYVIAGTVLVSLGIVITNR